jgi:hypothetical protein
LATATLGRTPQLFNLNLRGDAFGVVFILPADSQKLLCKSALRGGLTHRSSKSSAFLRFLQLFSSQFVCIRVHSWFNKHFVGFNRSRIV